MKSETSMGLFRNALYRCGLSDLGYSGANYTWSNGRKGEENVMERLDRAVANRQWKELFLHNKVQHLPRYKSNHSPILVNIEKDTGGQQAKPWRFKFEHMWLHHPKFQEILKSSWADTGMEENLDEKIKICSSKITQWASREFGSIRKKKKELYNRLSRLQKCEHSDTIVAEQQKVEAELDEVLKYEETMWFQRSRALWIKDGDRNSKFFHQKATHRKVRNTIKSIENEVGHMVTKQEEIEKVIRDYYVQIFAKERMREDATVLSALESKVTPAMNEYLKKPFTTDKVCKAITQMHPAKAPGPDGMTPLFYQKFWHICKHDVLKDVMLILNHGRDPTYLNHTHVVLIPKVKKPSSPKDLRPISLSNVMARIITKTIANRVKHLLPDIISETQSAFVPGRLITDNAMSAFEVFHTMKNKKTGKKGIMAMKLDMSKAYDRVEWEFLERVMERLGFCREWIALTMKCVTTVSYSVLVNGNPTNTFLPERDLRQGDPLSPFLFLFCAEAFSALLKQAELRGDIHGAVVAHNAPPISHLFFADDTILFSRANVREAEVIKQIIRQYECASGQRINLQKTEITVSANILEAQKHELSNILGVQHVERHSKYLGLPTLVGRSKKQVFSGIVDRVIQKMKNWKEKTLSQAGKEVLIKSVIQAIPSYSMNCFLFPITTCQEIEKATARFFWGSTIEDRKCHWAGWDILTTAKAQGGVGFREIHFFNLAMLAKQVWNLLHHPDSLSYRVLKAKYFPSGDFFRANLGNKPSYLWRSLLSSKEIVQEGSAWRVGDGRSINIFMDRWIGLKDPQRPNREMQGEEDGGTVDKLIDEQRRQWKRGVLEEKFSSPECAEILNIPLSSTPRADKRTWRFSSNGLFTVRSAYHMAVSNYSRIRDNRPSSSVVPREWMKIWRLKLVPRVKLFIWRACSGALPSKVNLCRRGFQVDPICVLCGEMEETIDHLMIRCTQSLPIWYGSVLRMNMNMERATTLKELIWQKLSTAPKQYVEIMCYIAWEIWRGRNRVCFENKDFSMKEVISRSYALWQEYACTVEKMETTTTPARHRGKWEKPRQGEHKLNSDVAVLCDGKIGMGFVIRDASGTVVLAGKNEANAMGGSVLLEGLALRYAMNMAVQYRISVDVVESDSKQLVDAINGHCKPVVYCDVLVDDIKQLARKVKCNRFDFILRSGNQVAHQAARGRDFLSLRHSPSHLRKFLDEDLRE